MFNLNIDKRKNTIDSTKKTEEAIMATVQLGLRVLNQKPLPAGMASTVEFEVRLKDAELVKPQQLQEVAGVSVINWEGPLEASSPDWKKIRLTLLPDGASETTAVYLVYDDGSQDLINLAVAVPMVQTLCPQAQEVGHRRLEFSGQHFGNCSVVIIQSVPQNLLSDLDLIRAGLMSDPEPEENEQRPQPTIQGSYHLGDQKIAVHLNVPEPCTLTFKVIQPNGQEVRGQEPLTAKFIAQTRTSAFPWITAGAATAILLSLVLFATLIL